MPIMPLLLRHGMLIDNSRGKSIAIRLAEDGFSVCVNDIAANSGLVDSVVSEIKALGRDSIGHIADVSKPSEVESLVSTCVEKLGPLTVMIANAGIVQVKSVLEMTDQDIRGVFDVNVIGVFNSVFSIVQPQSADWLDGWVVAKPLAGL
jgi:NAD(P)-dependent dehydrogenase (short-subunit alcohol dehydrogenase family)